MEDLNPTLNPNSEHTIPGGGKCPNNDINSTNLELQFKTT